MDGNIFPHHEGSSWRTALPSRPDGSGEPSYESSSIAREIYPEAHSVDLDLDVDAVAHPRFERPLQAGVREARLLGTPPWVRSLGKLPMDVKTEGWRFPAPPQEATAVKPRLHETDE